MPYRNEVKSLNNVLAVVHTYAPQLLERHSKLDKPRLGLGSGGGATVVKHWRVFGFPVRVFEAVIYNVVMQGTGYERVLADPLCDGRYPVPDHKHCV